jgi:ADP-ribose pyrophosphatase YjhB (NUDIX family)
VVVGAVTFQYPKQGGPRLLLLKRSAEERYFPGVFELPGGKVEDSPTDHTIQDAVIREMREETDLWITGILAELEPMSYTTEKKTVDNVNQDILVSSSAIQLNYVVSVGDSDVKLSKEHSESSWVAEKELGEFSMTEAMKVLVRHAFAWAANQQSGVDEK